MHDLCSGLMERGIDVRVVCRPSLYLPASDVPLQGRVTALPAAEPPAQHDTPFLQLWHTSRELYKAEELTAYDVVHIQSHYGFHAALHVVGRSGPRPARGSGARLLESACSADAWTGGRREFGRVWSA